MRCSLAVSSTPPPFSIFISAPPYNTYITYTKLSRRSRNFCPQQMKQTLKNKLQAMMAIYYIDENTTMFVPPKACVSEYYSNNMM